MSEIVETCNNCERRMLPAHRWKDADETMQLIYQESGMVRKCARGLCGPCYQRAARAGTVEQHDRATTQAAMLVEEWEHLSRRGASMASECRRLAPRMGTTPAALEKALNRAGVRSTWNGDGLGLHARDNRGRFLNSEAAA